MKRRFSRIAFVFVLAAAGIVIGAEGGVFLFGRWGDGVGAVFGTLALMFAGSTFDRMWPKPRPGWAE